MLLFRKAMILVIVIAAGYSNLHKNNDVQITVNQIGYLKDMNKHAWVVGKVDKGAKWNIINAETGKIVYSGSIKEEGKFEEACAEIVTCIDFSNFNKTGDYYIDVEGVGKSFKFSISENVYNDAFKASVKSYYFQRSGIELTPEYASHWAKPASHTNDAYLYEGFENGEIIKGKLKKSVGGWYDAGDFGKKIVPASQALYAILKLAQYCPEFVEQTKINIPNPYSGLPDMLAEAKWELDWFFTMQEDDGSVHHQIVTPEFYLAGPSYEDTYTRYIMPVTTAATADFASIMALASRIYKPYMPEYADSCLKVAREAWGFLMKNPSIIPKGGYNDPPGINQTGKYEDSNDSDERLWASAELYAATKKDIYRKYFEANYPKKIEGVATWWNLSNYAIYTWLETNSSNRDDKIVNELTSQVKAWADKANRLVNSKGFAVALETDDYCWGKSNSAALNTGMEMIIIDRILKTNQYEEIALNQLNYILGCNSLNLCFLTGFGEHGVRDPHQCINSYDDFDYAPPGFIPNGPNMRINGEPQLKALVEKYNLPPAKCYLDDHWAYSCNEVDVVYHSGFVFLSGYFSNRF
jgi:endoglucanase